MFATMDISKFNDGKVCFINSGGKGLKIITCLIKLPPVCKKIIHVFAMNLARDQIIIHNSLISLSKLHI